MYHWYIKVTLNNGRTVKGAFISTKSNWFDVVQELFVHGFHFGVMSSTPGCSFSMIVTYDHNEVSAFTVSRDPIEDEV